MKTVSREQALEVSSRSGNGTLIDWSQLDGDNLQAEVISLSPEEFGRRMTAFFKNGMRFILGGLKIACSPFNPSEFIGANWVFWKGSRDGDGLEGEEERDKVSLALTEVDFGKADFLTCLEKGKSSITGEEKLIRLKKLGRTIYGTTVAMGLWQNYQSCQNKVESALEKLYQQRGITYIDFFGDVLRGPYGYRFVLYFCRVGHGRWCWRCFWLGSDWGERYCSAVSQQVSSS
ncbi:MAG: hypothetical protein Q7K35_02620 [bacterium]|nr:hypothetical protein [bacterium]